MVRTMTYTETLDCGQCGVPFGLAEDFRLALSLDGDR